MGLDNIKFLKRRGRNVNLNEEQIKLLEDKIGYEKYIIQNVMKTINKIVVFDNTSSIIFIDHNCCGRQLRVKDSFSNSGIKEFVDDNLIPLLFITAYKMLDMVIETIIEANNKAIPYKFVDKIRDIDRLLNNKKIKVPNSISYNDWKYVVEIYKVFREKRNTIVHRKDFFVQNGNIIFNQKDLISKEQVYSFAAFTYILVEILIGNNNGVYNEALRNSLRMEINEITSLLDDCFTPLPEKYILIKIINYVINNKSDNKVNLTTIKELVNGERNFHNNLDPMNLYEVLYKLEINRLEEHWIITSSDIKLDINEIDLRDYEKFRIK